MHIQKYNLDPPAAVLRDVVCPVAALDPCLQLLAPGHTSPQGWSPTPTSGTRNTHTHTHTRIPWIPPVTILRPVLCSHWPLTPCTPVASCTCTHNHTCANRSLIWLPGPMVSSAVALVFLGANSSRCLTFRDRHDSHGAYPAHQFF